MQPDQPDKLDQWQQPNIGTRETHAYEGPVATPPAESDGNSNPTDETNVNQSAQPSPRQPVPGEDESVRWQATEYIHHEKNFQWYIILGVTTVLLMAVAILLMRSWSFAILIPVMAAALVVMSLRPPTPHSYTLSRKGLHIDDRLYPYSEFREFGLVIDESEHYIMLVPRQRFKPGVTVYFPQEVGEALVDMLAARLPMKQVKPDLIDRAVRFLRI